MSVGTVQYRVHKVQREVPVPWLPFGEPQSTADAACHLDPVPRPFRCHGRPLFALLDRSLPKHGWPPPVVELSDCLYGPSILPDVRRKYDVDPNGRFTLTLFHIKSGWLSDEIPGTAHGSACPDPERLLSCISFVRRSNVAASRGRVHRAATGAVRLSPSGCCAVRCSAPSRPQSQHLSLDLLITGKVVCGRFATVCVACSMPGGRERQNGTEAWPVSRR